MYPVIWGSKGNATRSRSTGIGLHTGRVVNLTMLDNAGNYTDQQYEQNLTRSEQDWRH